jgi:hypothetical protein
MIEWRVIESENTPQGRYGHRTITHNNKMFMFGGFNGKGRSDETFEFDLGTVVY